MPKKPKPGSSVLQNVMFSKGMYTKRQAEKWMKDHDMTPIKEVDDSGQYLRYRLTRNWQKGVEYKTIQLSPGILSAVAFTK